MKNHSNPNAYEVCWARDMASFFLIDCIMLNKTSSENSDFAFFHSHKVNDNVVSRNLKDVIKKMLTNKTIKNHT